MKIEHVAIFVNDLEAASKESKETRSRSRSEL